MSLLANVVNISSIAFQDIWSNKYVHAVITFVAFYFIAKIVVLVSERYLLKLSEKTKTKVDDLLIKKTNRPISFLLLLIGIKLALVPLQLKEEVSHLVNGLISSIVVILIVFVVIYIFDTLIEFWVKGWATRTKSRVDVNLLGLFHRFSRIVIMLLGLLFILQVWGIQIGPLLASLGIAGIAIAFALQNTLGNIFGGISLIIDKTVKKGDIVKLDSGESGMVYDVGIRSTKIKTWDNELITIPNGKLADSKVHNVSQPDPSIRINIELGVEYGSNPEKVKKLIIDTVKKIKDVMKDPGPVVWFLEMGDFALKFRLMFWVDDLSKKWPTHQEAMTNIYKALNKAKIGIPFPTRTLYMKK